MSSTRLFYGGAITASVCDRFADVSNIRQIPDHQEVMVDVDTDQSLIVELLSQADVPDRECANFHFQELARSNEAEGSFQRIHSSRPLAQEELPGVAAPGLLRFVVLGEQAISKFREEARNTVRIYMAVIRLPHITTDILITLNEPVHVAEGSSSQKNIQHASAPRVPAPKVFEEVLRTFCIRDWSLFC